MLPKRDGLNLRGAIAEDAVSEFLSNSVPLPINTISAVINLLVPSWLRPDYYVRWEDIAFLARHYSGIWGETIQIRLKDETYRIPYIIEFDNSVKVIPSKSIKFRSVDEIYKLENRYFAITEDAFKKYRLFMRLNRRLYKNGLLLRLSKLVEGNQFITLYVQPVYYQTVCRTNLCLDAKSSRQLATLRSRIHPNGALDLLEESVLANPLGVNCLLFTADGQLIMPLRSKKVVVRPGQLSPSFSGDFEAMDIKRHNGNLDAIHVIREGFEELGLTTETLKVDQVFFLGIARDLVRGGKPDAFFEAYSDLTKDSVIQLHKSAIDKWEYSSGGNWVFWPFGDAACMPGTLQAEQKYQLRRQFDLLLEQEGHRISSPLLANLVLWMQRKLGGAL